MVTRSSNQFGPYQFPEKLIPTVVLRAMEGKTIPVYGDGRQVRDWLHVDDHADALLTVREMRAAGHVHKTRAAGFTEAKSLAL